jgi:PKD repeat protein/photosystem II stability/assembly factor-like uncharacterized protein
MGMKKLLFLIGLICSTHLFAQITANWQLSGPVLFPTNISGQIQGMGRVTQVKFHPTLPNIMFATSSSGGLFKSTDGAQTWNVTGTDQLPALNCASVCIDYSNDQIMYLGTGDPNYYYDSYGIYKTMDGGATWNPSNTGIGNRMAVNILMHPTNDSILIAATDSGIWKSYNAGQTWVPRMASGNFRDMKFKAWPGTDTIYAVTQSAYFRSVDMGENWTQITNGVFIPNGNGKGMRLAVSAANPSCVYIGVNADEGTILRSYDGGSSFVTTYHNPLRSLTGYDTTGGGQGDYNFYLCSDPSNANTVYLVSHCVWKSLDAGVTWTKLTSWYAMIHTDMHWTEVDPYNTTRLFNANDGGVWLSTDGGHNWTPKSDGLDATENYHGAQSPIRHDLVSTGTQDNGEMYFGSGTWYCNRGGDWGDRMDFDYLIGNRVYYHGGNRRVVTGSDVSWGSPFVTNGGNTNMLFTPLQTNTAFISQKEVWRTSNLSASPPTWLQLTTMNTQVQGMAVSPADANDLYVIQDNNLIRHSVNALAASPTFSVISAPSSTYVMSSMAIVKSNTHILYLSCGSQVFRSVNQGINWTNVTYNLPLVNIIKIYHDDYSTDESVYVCMATGVYYKNNTMSSWVSYSQGLPSVANIQDMMVYNDDSPNSRLRVSYYGRGTWESPLHQLNQIPAADFKSNTNTICVGQTVLFSDLSTSNTTSWSWSFPGGIPASSNQQQPPLVTYNTAGTYSVTLVSSNANGSSTNTKTLFIQVDGPSPLPLVEGFQNAFAPTSWTIVDDHNDGVVWQQDTLAGGFGASSKSAFFDNYDFDVPGTHDGLETPKYDLSLLSGPMHMTFDVAYARWGAVNSDTLEVLVTTDCGITYTSWYLKGGTALATAPDFTPSIFIPTASQWRKDSVDLSAYAGQRDVMIEFRNHARYGQAIYIDNINLDPVGTGIKEHTTSVSASLFPNPNAGIFTLQVSSESATNEVMEVKDIAGKQIFKGNLELKAGLNTLQYDFHALQAGIYFLTLSNESKGSCVPLKFIVR